MKIHKRLLSRTCLIIGTILMSLMLVSVVNAQDVCQECVIIPEDEPTPYPYNPPAVDWWLAYVCEPDDGYSEGYIELTWDSDAEVLFAEDILQVYVGPYNPNITIEELEAGEWKTVGTDHVLTPDEVAAIMAAAGVDSVDQLWLRVSSSGYPQILGDAIRNRDMMMAEICTG